MISGQPTPTSRTLFFFRCGSRAVAVPLEFVREVVCVESLVRLPLAPPRMIGLCTLRRDVIPIFALAGSGQDQVNRLSWKGSIVILKIDQGIWGLLIEDEGVVLGEDTGSTSGQQDNRHVRLDDVEYELLDASAAWNEAKSMMIYA